MLLLVLFVFYEGVVVENITVHTSRGASVEVYVELPSGAGPFAAVVLAPGQGYHMRLPLLEQTARALVREGIAVYRFNWAYFTATPKGTPSEQLTFELQDMQAVINLARTASHIDPKRIAVGGKSLGSLVAWQVFEKDKSLAGLLLMTPVCSRIPDGQTEPKSEAAENYPGLAAESRPLAFVLGDQDSFCATDILQRFVSTLKVPPRISIMKGDHNFEVKGLTGTAGQAARDSNLQAVTQFAADFFRDVFTQ